MSPSPVAIRKPRVAVVFGGRSSEHAISCITAGSVLNAIDRDVYDVAAIGICADGRWVLESDDTSRLVLKGAELPAVDGTRPAVSLMRSQGHTDLVVTESGQPPRTIGELDVVFPVLHGPWGEDGTIQGMLEMSGVRYVGAGVLASAVGMDKDYMKTILKAAGLPVTSGIVLTRRQWLADRDAALEGLANSSAASLGASTVFHRPRAWGSCGLAGDTSSTTSRQSTCRISRPRSTYRPRLNQSWRHVFAKWPCVPSRRSRAKVWPEWTSS